MRKTRTLKQKVCKYCGRTFSTLTNANFCSRVCAIRWRQYFARKDIKKQKGCDTLCWECVKARADSDCSWANEFVPVEGWTAISTKHEEKIKKGSQKGQIKVVESYLVKSCPLFKMDEQRY